MTEQIAYLLGYALIGAMTLLLIRKKMLENKEQNQVWAEFAKKYGFEYQGEKITGNYDGLNMSLYRYANQSFTNMSVVGAALDKDKGKIFTILKISMPNLPDGLQLYVKDSDFTISSAENVQVIKASDPDFDKTFLLYGKDSGDVLRYLSPEKRKSLYEYAKTDNRWRIESQKLVFSLPDILSDFQVFERKFQEIITFAKMLA